MKKQILIILSLLTFRANNSFSQWSTHGPFGGLINALAADGNNIYAGTGNGVFLSANNGQTWTEANNGMQRKPVSSLEVNGTSIFAGTSGQGIYLSTNSGTTWTPKNIGLSDLHIISMI